MKPEEEKAEELIEKFNNSSCRGIWGGDPTQDENIHKGRAKQCALIDCQNTIDTLEEINTAMDAQDDYDYSIHNRLRKEINEIYAVMKAIGNQ